MTATPMEPDAFKRWLKSSRPGDRVIYYEGHLAHDREGIVTVIGPDGSGVRFERKFYQPQHALGQATYEAWEKNQVHLLQKRTGDAKWFYIAERRKTR